MGGSISVNHTRARSDASVVNSASFHNDEDGERRSFSLVSFSSLTGALRRPSTTAGRCVLHKPLCRDSRRRRLESSLSEMSGVSKTTWPVKMLESLFLPEFKIKADCENLYQILEEIGRGAYSRVYKVKSPHSEEKLAMKIISKAKVVSEDCVAQVKEEVLVQSSCGHHTFIATCVEYWQSKRYLFIVSEHLSGGELWLLLRQHGTLPEPASRIYIAEIALAIDFLHNAGVVYRDMKLENVVLDSSGHARLVDFGLCKRLKYGSRTSTLCGTMQFIGSYGHAADWWSLGVVATLLLTGQYPEQVQERMKQLANNPETEAEVINLRSPTQGVVSTSVAARDMLSRLLTADPSLRLRSLNKLQTIAFFNHFNFDHVREKKVSPLSLLSEPLEQPLDSGLFDGFESPAVFI